VPADPRDVEAQKAAAAAAAAELIIDGMRVGLGSGTTVAKLLPAIAALGRRGLRCAATSPATEASARDLGLTVEPLDDLGALDIAIDGADQIADDGWLIKGKGGAHTHEKIVARSAAQFVVIASAEKAVARLSAPVPLEILRYGARTTLDAAAPAELRQRLESPEGSLLAYYTGPVDDPGTLAARLSATPGVVDHGLFEPELVGLVLIAGPAGVERRAGRGAA